MKFKVVFTVLLALSFFSAHAAYDFTISETEHKYIDGVNTPSYAINSSVPGPLVRGEEGENISINVTNELEESTTLHWHGLQVDNEMDGVPGLTQEGIKPGESFEYRLNLDNPGTYWYHSHDDSGRQVEKGLQGPLIIDAKDDPYSHLPERVLMVDDVRLNEDGTHARFGIGVMHGRFGNRLVVNGKENPSLTLPKGYSRLRLINSANARVFNLRIPNASTYVIGEGIGFLENPEEREVLTVQPSDRLDVVVHNEGEDDLSLQYVRRDRSENIARFTSEEAVVDNLSLKAREQEYFNFCPAYKAADLDVVLRGRNTGRGIEWMINDKSSLREKEVFEAKEGKVYVVNFSNVQAQPHPMHLHGQKMKVIERNGERADGPWRDTVTVDGNEEVIAMFRAEGKGEWAFHCHILEHSEAGMMSTLNIS